MLRIPNEKEITLDTIRNKRFIRKFPDNLYVIIFRCQKALELGLYYPPQQPCYFITGRIERLLQKEVGKYIDGEINKYHSYETDCMVFSFKVREGLDKDLLNKLGYDEVESVIPNPPSLWNGAIFKRRVDDF